MDVHQQGLPLTVLVVEADLDGDGQFIAAVDLGPSGHAGPKLVHIGRGAQRDQIILIEQGGTRTHQALTDLMRILLLCRGRPQADLSLPGPRPAYAGIFLPISGRMVSAVMRIWSV